MMGKNAEFTLDLASEVHDSSPVNDETNLYTNKFVVDRTESGTEQNALWSAEQLLRAAAGAVLLWIEKADAHALRRLQLAAEESDSCVLLYRSERHAAESTPSALRLRIWRQNAAPQVEVLKCRGARPLPIPLRAAA